MPFIPNMDEEAQPGQGAIAPGTGGTRLSPSGIGSVPSAGSAPAPQGAGGQFATLQSYLTANQGQAEPLANKITSGIQNQYNTLQGQNASTLSGIQGQVAQGATPENKQLLDQEAANPVSFAANPSNIQSFQKQLTDQYTGPQSAESTADFTKQQNAVNNAIATGTAQTGTEAGREQLLAQNEARPTTGVTALNSAILTQSPDYLGQVQGAYKPFSNLLSSLNTGAQGIDTQIGQATQEAQDASQKANQQIASQNAGLNTNLANELNTATQQANTYNNSVPVYNSGLQSLKQLAEGWNGWNQLSWDPNFGVRAQPINDIAATAPGLQSINVPTQNQVATQDQLNLQNALNALSGQTLNSTINPNAPIGGWTAPSTSASLAPIADTLHNELQNAGHAVYQTQLNPLATDPNGAQHFNELLNYLNNELGGLNTQLKTYDPTLGQIAI